MPTPVPPPHHPDEVIAAAFLGPDDSGVYPAVLGVHCDGCGAVVEHEHIVREDSTRADRFELARAHLRKHGWSCTPDHDLCPDCTPA